MHTDNTGPAKLWTRDFTILTLGSVVSMLGNALCWFAMDLDRKSTRLNSSHD